MLPRHLFHIFTIVSRWLVGGVFLFSGFVKAVDPLGSAYKFQDYFQVLSLDFLNPIATGLAVLLAALEFMIGFNLILRNLEKINLRLLLVFMLFFTFLTLWIALKNPVSDCGCFGDALIISNWQTFFKNLVLLVLSVLLLKQNDYKTWSYRQDKQVLKALIGVLFSVLISVYCIVYLPIIDFRPYKVGTDIPKMMKVPEGAPTDEYKTLFYYSKDGETQEFDETNYPWQDSTWTFVEMKSELISKGYTPPIHGFSLNHTQRGDITQEVLQSLGYTYLLLAPRLNLKTFSKVQEQINALQEMCIKNNLPIYLVTSSTDERIEELNRSMSMPLEVLNADEITIKTIIRSNPGVLILKEGHIIAKFSTNNLPEIKDLEDPIGLVIEKAQGFKNQINLITLGLILGGLIWWFSKSKKRDIN